MYMTQRLVRMRNFLQPTGSIFLHCDPTASHYLKVIMDGLFGRDNFRNEIVWCYHSRPNPKQHFGRKHDVILFYSKSDRYVFNADKARRALSPATAKKYRLVDADGRRYRLQGRGIAGSPIRSQKDVAQHWETDRPELVVRDYWSDNKGMTQEDWWTDIPILNQNAKERLGYPTQKPSNLLKRIIDAASNEGDIICDPFCGCGTSIMAARQLKRRWIGIDISGNAIDEINQVLSRFGTNADYDLFEGQPVTMAEYNRMNAFEKQDWLIRRVDGLPNPRKSGDRGVDGDMTIHLGVDGAGQDQWGRVVFSVKTGKQRKPEHVRELIGTMKNERADMGVLILDVESTAQMEEAAQRAKQLSYQQRADMPPKEYDRVQILTAYEIIEGAKVDCPPTREVVQRYREAQMEMRV